MKRNAFMVVIILIFLTCNVYSATSNWKSTIQNCIEKNNQTVTVSIGKESKNSLDAFIKKSCINKNVSNYSIKYNSEKKAYIIKFTYEKIKTISFSDSALEALIREKINKPIGDITNKDVRSITSLESNFETGKGDRIRSLSGIENLTNLNSLTLNGHLIKDLSPLKSLTNLETLDLSDNRIYSVNALSDLKNLKSVSMNFNFIEDITPIKKLKELRSLSLYQNDISDVSALSELFVLDTLDISENVVNDVSSLSKLKYLKYVDVNDNPIADLSPIKRLFTDRKGQKIYQQTEALGAKAKEIISKNINSGMSEDEKLRILRDYIVLNNTYDFSEFDKGIPTKSSPYTAYGALCEEYSVCEGYTRAFKILCRLAGLKVDYISGFTSNYSGSSAHDWNSVCINGNISYIDVTWSDPDKGNEISPGYFKVKYNDLIRERKWDIEKYPKPESISLDPNSKQIKVKINSEQPIENEMLIWIGIGIRGGINDGRSLNVGRSFAVPVVVRKGTEMTEAILSVSEADYKLLYPFVKDGTAKYSLSYSIYYGYKNPNFDRTSSGCNKKTGWAAYNEEGNFTSFDGDFGITLLKMDSRGIDFDKANYQNNYFKNKYKYKLTGDIFKVYTKQTNTYQSTNGSYKENVYYLKNTKEFNLPPYSILYLATDTNVMSLPTDNRPNLMRRVIISNNSNKDLHYSINQLDYSLQWIFQDVVNTEISQDGTERVVSSKDAYVRLVVFDGSIDEKFSCEELISNGNVIDMSDWLKTNKDITTVPEAKGADTTPIDFKPDYSASLILGLNQINFSVVGTLTGDIDTKKLRYVTSARDKTGYALTGRYKRIEFTSAPEPGQYYYLKNNSETIVYIFLTTEDANKIKSLKGYGNEISSSGTNPGWKAGEEFSIQPSLKTTKIVFYVGTYVPNVKPIDGKMKIVQVDVNSVSNILIDDTGWITVNDTNFGQNTW